MKFENSDAWLLEAIKFSENRDQGATLTDIIQAADSINIAIMTHAEFITGARKLKSIGLIIEKDKRFQTTKRFNEWWTQKYGQKSRFSVLKAMEEIETYLKNNYGNIEEHTKEMGTEITTADWDRATMEYHKLAEGLYTKLTKNKRNKGV